MISRHVCPGGCSRFVLLRTAGMAEDLKDAIEKQFAAAEQNRQLATSYWKEMFTEMRQGHAAIAEQLEKLEERVAALEIDWIAKDDPELKLPRRLIQQEKPLKSPQKVPERGKGDSRRIGGQW